MRRLERRVASVGKIDKTAAVTRVRGHLRQQTFRTGTHNDRYSRCSFGYHKKSDTIRKMYR